MSVTLRSCYNIVFAKLTAGRIGLERNQLNVVEVHLTGCERDIKASFTGAVPVPVQSHAESHRDARR